MSLAFAALLAGVMLAARRSIQSEIESRPEKIDMSHPLMLRLRDDLRSLEAMPISSKEDRTKWEEAARVIERRLRSEYAEVFDLLPHELWHYLSDPELRSKDQVYAARQKRHLGPLLDA